MKITAITAAVLMLASTAQGRSETGRQVTVLFIDNATIPPFVRSQAQGLASEMFAEIGVTLHWRSDGPLHREPGAVVVEFVADTPPTLLPGALAYALPYEGTHIRIFWDRIKHDPSSQELLAHVMAHEITHILQGISRHSAEGIMKARWSEQDRRGMKLSHLRFTPEDVEKIYIGIDARGNRTPNPAALASNVAAVEVAAE